MRIIDSNPLSIGDHSGWRFVNGNWEDRADGGLAPLQDVLFSDGDTLQGHHYAFQVGSSYGDVTISFEFLLRPHSDAGIILRAKDQAHFYLLHFPNCGQACRAQHFWAVLSRMDEAGYLKVVKLEMVRRVPSNSEIWLSARATVTDGKISVDIGEHGHFEVEDESFSGGGCVGVYLYRRAEIRNVVIRGEKEPSVWNDEPRQPTNWFQPCPDTVYGLGHQPLDIVRVPSGGLLLNYRVDRDGAFAGSTTPLLARSQDNGRKWSEPEILQVVQEDGRWLPTRLWLTPGRRLISMTHTQAGLALSESKDEGRTWSQPAPVDVELPPGMKGMFMGPQAFLNLADGSMLWFLYGGYKLDGPDLTVSNFGAVHCRAYCLRSTDDGRTWSSPANMDNSAGLGVAAQADSLDLTETCAAQMADGRIMALIRPCYSPWMWETWSDDGGFSWGPCVRGEFPGYATPNMLRTSSGRLLVAHRLPSLAIHCSGDDGHTFDQGTVIDGSLWVMGSMLEIERDLVLYIYMTDTLMRGQFIRVTSAGLEPVRC